jgi:hypothetical protein
VPEQRHGVHARSAACPHRVLLAPQDGLAYIDVITAVRSITPPCRRDSGQPGVSHSPGRPARVRPVRALLAARAGVLADGIMAGQDENIPPMYLRRSACTGRTETVIPLEQPVLDPC